LLNGKGVEEMLIFMVDHSHYVVTSESEETIRELWNCYHGYRCDTTFTFYEFLRENGVSFTVTPPNFTLFGRDIRDIEISLN